MKSSMIRGGLFIGVYQQVNVSTLTINFGPALRHLCILVCYKITAHQVRPGSVMVHGSMSVRHSTLSAHQPTFSPSPARCLRDSSGLTRPGRLL